MTAVDLTIAHVMKLDNFLCFMFLFAVLKPTSFSGSHSFPLLLSTRVVKRESLGTRLDT